MKIEVSILLLGVLIPIACDPMYEEEGISCSRELEPGG